MTGVKFISPEQAAAIVSDDSTVGLVGGGGGLVEASTLHLSLYTHLTLPTTEAV